MRIDTPEDWWRALEVHSENIQRCIELVYVKPDKFLPIKKELVEAFEARDAEKAHGILVQTWNDAPDRPYIHGWPSWHILCDLCSESSVLYEG